MMASSPLSSSVIALRCPSQYAPPSSTSSSTPPPPTADFLHRTWTVTHSTLPLWRSARNVRITYKPLPPDGKATRVDDLVEYEALDGKGAVKTVRGVDTASAPPDTRAWDWRGRGLLFFLTSHWEILGWGERPLGHGGVERWVVTWFAPTVFTNEGVDVYSDRREGGSSQLVEEILNELTGLKEPGADKVADMCKRHMRVVKVELPWNKR